MTVSGIAVVCLALLTLGSLCAGTVVFTCRGGRGPLDPPASHERSDPAGFPVRSEPKGIRDGRAAGTIGR